MSLLFRIGEKKHYLYFDLYDEVRKNTDSIDIMEMNPDQFQQGKWTKLMVRIKFGDETGSGKRRRRETTHAMVSVFVNCKKIGNDYKLGVSKLPVKLNGRATLGMEVEYLQTQNKETPKSVYPVS